MYTLQIAVVYSGHKLACGTRGSRIEPALRTSFCIFNENYCDSQLSARAAYILRYLGRLSRTEQGNVVTQ